MSIQYTVPGYELIITRPGLPPKLLKKYWIAQNEMIHRIVAQREVFEKYWKVAVVQK